MKTSLLLTLSAVALLSLPALAQEGDERSKIKDLESRARSAKQQGNAEEAQKWMEQAEALRAKARKSEGQDDAGDKPKASKPRVDMLRNAGRREEAQARDQQPREATGTHDRRDHGPGQPDGHDRAEHIREAVRHLHAAGLHEPAENISKMLRQQDRDPMQRAMHEMQERTQRMMRETHEQMAKMARAIEELREQVGKQRPEGERRKDQDRPDSQ
jgi:hypothetical protein